MSQSINTLILIVILFLAGCGSDRVAPPSDSEIADQTKASVTQFIEKARDSKPEQAKADLALLLESLEARSGEQGAEYAELLESAKTLMTKYESSASNDEIKAQLDELNAKAAALSK